MQTYKVTYKVAILHVSRKERLDDWNLVIDKITDWTEVSYDEYILLLKYCDHGKEDILVYQEHDIPKRIQDYLVLAKKEEEIEKVRKQKLIDKKALKQKSKVTERENLYKKLKEEFECQNNKKEKSSTL